MLENFLPMRRQIESEHPDGSGCRSDETEQHLNGGGLAGAIRTEHAQDLAGADVERNPVDCGEVPESLGKVCDFNDGAGHIDHRHPR